MNNKIILIIFVALSFAWAETSTGQKADVNLGSPQETSGVFSTDYKTLVTSAMPRVTASELASRLRTVLKESAATKPLAIQDARTWMSFFDIKFEPSKNERTNELIDTENASYKIDPLAGRYYISIRNPNVQPFSRQDFAKILPEIRSTHKQLAEKIGIPSPQIFFADFRETLAQSTPQPTLSGEKEGPIESVGARTTLLRAVGGLLVDGSFVHISSIDAKRFDMVDVRWPQLLLAPEVKVESVLAPNSLTDRIVRRVESSAKGKAINARMAVVLRPFQSSEKSHFVPSLRVGVRPKSEPNKDGYLTEAGEVIYFDLVPGLEGLADRDERELVPENLERKPEKQ